MYLLKMNDVQIWRRIMSADGLAIFGIGGGFLVASLALSFFLGKRRNKAGLWLMGLLWGCTAVLMALGMSAATGWDGLGYLFVLILVHAPSGVGGLIGGIVGWAKSGPATDEPALTQ
jgi:hypothetical protein